jgi:tetratricopeptide (TPR) repeat protein
MRAWHVLGLAAVSTLVALQPSMSQRPPQACDQFEAALRTNPDNLDAAAGLGRCAFRDYEMIAPGGDSSRLAFRSSWSTALRALRHAVQIDPTYANAYRPLFRILFAETRDGCSFVTGYCLHVAAVVRDADTLVTVPRLVEINAVPDPYAVVVQQSQTTRRESLIEARDIARRWSAVAPNDPRPHEYIGQALLGLGDATGAANELELAAAMGTVESRRAMFWDRIEALIKTDRGDDARRVLDEAVADPGRDTSLLRGYAVAGLNALLGRNRPHTLTALDSVRFRPLWARRDSMLRANPPRRDTSRSVSHLLAVGDTAGARRALARIDSSVAPPNAIMSVGEHTLWSAQQHLTLGDTAGALARLDDIERVLNSRQLRFAVSRLDGGRPWLGRAWMLAGDIAAARGQTAEAKRMYSRVVGLWGGGDPEVRPVVDQARGKLDSLTRR